MSKHIVNKHATLVFSPAAFCKMVSLIFNFDTEVAWHGVAKRDETTPNKFIINDILVYPQYVTGGTVNTDQEPYEKWLNGLDDETFSNLRMQGHSHVTMGTTPSLTDDQHREKLVSQLENDMFYIFLIWNKRLEHTNLIYDMTCNTLYEDKDISVVLGEEGVDIPGFIKSAKEVVSKKVYNPPAPPYYSNVKKDEPTSGTKPASADEKKSENKADNKQKAPDKTHEEASKVQTKSKDKPQLGNSMYAGYGYGSGYGYGYGHSYYD